MTPDPPSGQDAWQRFLESQSLNLATARLPQTFTHEGLAKATGREPRLLLSMDEREKWPAPLRKHGVFPISVSSREFALVRGDAWFDLPALKGPPREISARLPFNLASATIGRGENTHIMRLETSGFLKDFLGADQLVPVSSGKRVSPAFTVRIGGQPLRIQGIQYEMDHQYESATDVVPIEAKATEYASCAIRQIYLPYRSLGEALNWSKAIRPLFITYNQQEDSYRVREMGFHRKDEWDSIFVAQSDNVRIRVTAPPRNLLDLNPKLLPSLRLPQADSASRIERFPMAVAAGINTPATIAQYFGFDPRQSGYYRDACQMLGLVEPETRGQYKLTADGRRYINLNPQARADEIARRMCRLPAVNAVLLKLEAAGDKGLNKDDLKPIIQSYAEAKGEPCTGATAGRRAQTVSAWLRYIGARTGAIVRVQDRFYLRAHAPSLDEFP